MQFCTLPSQVLWMLSQGSPTKKNMTALHVLHNGIQCVILMLFIPHLGTSSANCENSYRYR